MSQPTDTTPQPDDEQQDSDDEAVEILARRGTTVWIRPAAGGPWRTIRLTHPPE